MRQEGRLDPVLTDLNTPISSLPVTAPGQIGIPLTRLPLFGLRPREEIRAQDQPGQLVFLLTWLLFLRGAVVGAGNVRPRAGGVRSPIGVLSGSSSFCHRIWGPTMSLLPVEGLQPSCC